MSLWRTWLVLFIEWFSFVSWYIYSWNIRIYVCCFVGFPHAISPVKIGMFSNGLEYVSYGYTPASCCVISTGVKLYPRKHVSALELVSLFVIVPVIGFFISWYDDVFNVDLLSTVWIVVSPCNITYFLSLLFYFIIVLGSWYLAFLSRFSRPL